MKKLMKAMKALVVSAVLFTCSGCTMFGITIPLPWEPAKSASMTTAVVVAVSDVPGTSAIDFNDHSTQDYIEEAVESAGTVVAVEMDGSPYPYMKVEVPAEYKGTPFEDLDEKTQKKVINSCMKVVNSELSKSEYRTKGSDILKGLHAAAVAAKESCAEYNVLIIKSHGLQTTGYLDMTKTYEGRQIWELDYIEALKKADALEDLSIFDEVLWLGCGVTDDPQPELNAQQKYGIKAMWKDILMECGVGSVDFEDITYLPNTKDYGNGEAGIVKAKERSIMPKIVLDESVLEFVGNSAEFKYPDLAEKELKKAADQIKKYPDNQVNILGMTASGNQEICDDLSQRRAQAVADALIEYGVPGSQIALVKGLGCDSWWHIDGDLVDGQYVEDIAGQNRKVLILDTEDEESSHIS